MRKDIATDRLLWVYYVRHAPARISSHLISQKDSYIELLADFLQLAQHFT